MLVTDFSRVTLLMARMKDSETPQMSSFVPDPLDDRSPPFREEPSSPVNSEMLQVVT
jgi:hypothetical protein